MNDVILAAAMDNVCFSLVRPKYRPNMIDAALCFGFICTPPSTIVYSAREKVPSTKFSKPL
jgi:hypothetical protein